MSEKAAKTASARGTGRDRKPPQRFEVPVAEPKKRSRSASPSPKKKAAATTKKTKATKTGKRAKKDPNAPRRPLSSYMFYVQAARDGVLRKHPGIAFGEVGKILGEQWKKLKASEKKEFEDQNEKDKKRYAKEMEAYSK